ncbi:hypothetical protein [Enterococcus wangshanyuanii]|uniref:Uncharacterized protein n=1 Tax=Enterococcus wangshanyuanii TaxID=2005703 RepID=A0ABQ1NIJ0_9ENTE|nr:hypothetical protein [Enterococcus wangshanyuanii]GGC74598.1 hypothetical protein GCM10011573_00120 [Enterococcus wangshanyuanii]
MKETREITMEQLKQLAMNDIDKKIIICTGGELRIADLPEHGTAGVKISDSKFQRMEYNFTTK